MAGEVDVPVPPGPVAGALLAGAPQAFPAPLLLSGANTSESVFRARKTDTNQNRERILLAAPT